MEFELNKEQTNQYKKYTEFDYSKVRSNPNIILLLYVWFLSPQKQSRVGFRRNRKKKERNGKKERKERMKNTKKSNTEENKTGRTKK